MIFLPAIIYIIKYMMCACVCLCNDKQPRSISGRYDIHVIKLKSRGLSLTTVRFIVIDYLIKVKVIKL